MWSNKEAGLVRFGGVRETSCARQEMKGDPIYESFLDSFFKAPKGFRIDSCLEQLFILA
jgi:hypothetical protein